MKTSEYNIPVLLPKALVTLKKQVEQSWFAYIVPFFTCLFSRVQNLTKGYCWKSLQHILAIDSKQPAILGYRRQAKRLAEDWLLHRFPGISTYNKGVAGCKILNTLLQPDFTVLLSKGLGQLGWSIAKSSLAQHANHMHTGMWGWLGAGNGGWHPADPGTGCSMWWPSVCNMGTQDTQLPCCRRYQCPAPAEQLGKHDLMLAGRMWAVEPILPKPLWHPKEEALRKGSLNMRGLVAGECWLGRVPPQLVGLAVVKLGFPRVWPSEHGPWNPLVVCLWQQFLPGLQEGVVCMQKGEMVN